MHPSSLVRRATGTKVRLRWIGYRLADRFRAPAVLHCRICDHRGPASAFPELRTACRFGGGPLVRHQCPACGAVFGSERMLSLGPAQLAREYRDAYLQYDEGATTDFELEAFRHLEPVRGRTYLNYGAGRWSEALVRLRAEGYDVVGFDRYAAGSSGVLSDAAALAKLRFDGIMSHAVLEHLPDPVSEFRFMRSLLRDERSRMAHSTPCYRYEWEFTRFHLFFYTGRSLEVLAERAGLRVEDTANPDVKRFWSSAASPASRTR